MEEEILRVHLKQHLCVGAGLCVLSSPEVFDQREEDGIVVVHEGQDHPAQRLHESVRNAARKCPVLAIEIEQD